MQCHIDEYILDNYSNPSFQRGGPEYFQQFRKKRIYSLAAAFGARCSLTTVGGKTVPKYEASQPSCKNYNYKSKNKSLFNSFVTII